MNDVISLKLSDIYAEDGPIAENITDYIYRDQQLVLASEISSAIKNKKILLAEAGTGTGKTLAYLIPALLSSSKVIISTGTKNLQNQLYFRDLPLAVKSLNVPVSRALLKGRTNYLCKYRLEIALTDLLLANTEMVLQLKEIINWSEATNDGDISTVSNIPEDAEIWQNVVSTADNCLSQDCPFISNCFVYKARQKAMDADIIVINHHLLLSDWSIKSENLDARLLPNGVNLILDEAHQLAQIASFYFGNVISSKKIKYLLQEIEQEQQENAKDQIQIKNITKDISNVLELIQQILSDMPNRGFYNSLTSYDDFSLNFAKLADFTSELLGVLELNAERSKGLELCYERVGLLFSDLNIFSNSDTNHKNSSHIKWYEVFRNNFIFKQSPLEINDLFSEKLLESSRACILTSATITVAGSFDLIKSNLGLADSKTLKIASPFDYPEKSMLYVPRSMPDPASDNYIDSYIKQVLPVLHHSRGSAFLLFTSFNAMRIVHDKLTELLEGDDFTLLMQGQASKSSLVQSFREEDNAVLLATQSFWEGIDVKGEDLHCVIIDKLPFATPNEPLLQAKIKHLRQQGKNPFLELQCQQAALQLVQGAGRLIRSEQDYGVLMICDPRIISKSYGNIFLDSLPDMKRTRDINKIKEFYDKNMV